MPTFVGAPPPGPGPRVPLPAAPSPGTPGAIPLPAPEGSGEGDAIEPDWPPPEEPAEPAEPPLETAPEPPPEVEPEVDAQPFVEPEVLEVEALAPDEKDMFKEVASSEPEPEPGAAPEPFAFGEVSLDRSQEEDPFATPKAEASLADEELEMLFSPESASAAAPPPPPPRKSGEVHYKIRRPSGRIFGPFTEREIGDMLGKGELNGSEDVSAGEGDEWLPIASVAVFEKAVKQM